MIDSFLSWGAIATGSSYIHCEVDFADAIRRVVNKIIEGNLHTPPLGVSGVLNSIHLMHKSQRCLRDGHSFAILCFLGTCMLVTTDSFSGHQPKHKLPPHPMTGNDIIYHDRARMLF